MTRFLFSLLLILPCWSARSETVNVAVAANFAAPMLQIANRFELHTGNIVHLSFGATGKFFAQISNGAPFDILLSADQTTPARLAEYSVPGSQFTYAIGALALWSAQADLVDTAGAVLKSDRFLHLAIAEPGQAPYGTAALQTLQSLGLADVLAKRLVQGESIGQTFVFVSTGNAELGFVALSQIWEQGKFKSGSAWIVPEHLHAPLRQDAVLLVHGKNNRAAQALLAYLKTDAAQTVMRTYGYHF